MFKVNAKDTRTSGVVIIKFEQYSKIESPSAPLIGNKVNSKNHYHKTFLACF